MSSTISPSLRIELIGDGDQSGIWGQTTNSNLGTIIEQAITGVVGITMLDANYTMSSFNGVADESRNAVLVLTGTLTQQRNLVAPLVEKTYSVKNSTTGGFGVQIIGSSGTGVVIPNGQTIPVYCDGTNFYALVTGTATNFSVTGNLAVSGTTALTGATTLSSALTYGGVTLSNSVTGTGSMALSASPTFTGTPLAPTATTGTNTTQIATTAFVQASTTALGLGTMSTQNANAVAITGGTVSGLSSLAVTGTSTFTGIPTGPTAAVGTNNTQLATTAFVRSIIPSGVILLWSGSIASIPSGWYLCDGNNGTPNLVDRFVVGAGSTYAVGATGGATTVTLSEANLPSHTHSISASGTTSTADLSHTHSVSASGTTAIQSNGHTHTFSGTSSGQSANHTHGVSDPGHAHGLNNLQSPTNSGQTGRNDGSQSTWNTSTSAATTGISLGINSVDHTHTYSGTTSDISANHTHTVSVSGTSGAMSANATHNHTVTVTGTSGATGSGTAFSILPPYYALAYIMKA